MTTLSKPWESVLATSAFRAAAVVVAVFTLVASAIMWFVSHETNRVMTRQALEELRADVKVFRAEIGGGGEAVLRRAIEIRSNAGGPALYYLGRNDGTWLAGNLRSFPDELRSGGPSAVFEYIRSRRSTGAVQANSGETRMAVGMMLAYSNTVVVVARDIEDQRTLSRQILLLSLVGFGLLGILGLLAGAFISRFVLARVDRMTKASRTIMAGDLSQRLARDESGDEFDRLAQSFNEMLARIEQLMHGLREVSDNIAHDLKTPLNRLRIRAEEALRDPRGAEAQRQGLERTIEAADDLIRTFNALLLIARLEAGAIEETLEEVDITTVVSDVVELYEPVAAEAGLSLNMSREGNENISLAVNKHLVGQAVANLIDNAIKYSIVGKGRVQDAVVATSGGDATELPVRKAIMDRSAHIDVGVRTLGSGVEISVGDHGPGIDATDRERVLKRFVRLERSRTAPGTGLGLSLVSAVARLHGGAVRLEDNAPGLRVVLLLPFEKSGTDPSGV